MADGSVKIDITADDSDIKEKIDDTEESLSDLGDKQKETQKETEKTTSKFQELAETIDKQEKELKDLKSEYIETAINLGENSKEAQNLKEEFSSLNAELKENKARFTSVADGLEDLEDGAKQSGKGFNLLEGVISTFVGTSLNDLAGKLLEVVGNLIALADETREYREDMAKLDTAFKDAGHSTETAQKAYDGFYRLLGESDRSVEAVNHLAELTSNTEEVAKWTDIAAGVTAKFGDSLPLEGLTEAANETAKVGQTTGVLADALNWASADSAVFTEALGGNNKALAAFNQAIKDGENVEDAFTAALGKMTTEQERSAAITNTLNGLYKDAAAEYNALTASTQAAREATNRMEQAQAALGAAIEPLTTKWTNFKAAALEWVTEGLTAKQTTDILTESQREQINTVNELATSYENTRAAAAELAGQQLADVDYATNTLLPQLQALVDANGNVKQGYEERANFILGQLNEAYGKEYTNISQIVGKNGELKQSILDTIEAKKAQILLSSHEESYKIAVENIEKEKRARNDLQIAIAEQMLAIEEAEQNKAKVVEESAGKMVRARELEISKAEGVVVAAKLGLKELQVAYDEADANYQKHNDVINAYDEARILIMEGQTDEALSFLYDLQEGYEDTGSQAKKTADDQKGAVEERLKTTAIALGMLKEEYAQKEKDMTEAQKKEMQARIKQLEEEVDKQGTEAEKLGSNLVEGIGVGADGKKNWLSGKLGGIVQAAIDKAKEVGIIKSPSRKMRDEVGKMLVAGMAVGIDEWADKPAESMHSVFDTMENVLDAEKKTTLDMVKEYNAELENLDAEHNKELERLKQENAEALTNAEESKNKRLSELEEKYIEDKKKNNEAKTKLDEDYKKSVDDVKEKLEENAEAILKAEEDKNKRIAERDEKYLEDTKRNNEEKLKLEKEYKKKVAEINEQKNKDTAYKNKKLAELEEKYIEDKKKNNEAKTKLDKDYNKDIAEIKENTAEKIEALNKTEEDGKEKLLELEKNYTKDKKKNNEEKLKLDKNYNKNVKEVHENAAKEELEITKKYNSAIENEEKRHADNVKKIQDSIDKTIKDKMQEIISLGDTYKENVKTLWEDLDKSITDLQANYDNQLASRTASIASSLNLWNKATINRPAAGELTNNLKSQIDVLEKYNNAIATLEERGVSDDFINYLKQLGVGSAGEIQTIARMTDKRLEEYVGLFEEKNKLAKEAAIEELEPLKAETEEKIQEVTNAALEKYVTLRAEFQEQGTLLLTELKDAMIAAGVGGYEEVIGQIDEYTTAGEGLLEGIITGIVNKSPALQTAVTTAVNSAIQAAKDAAGIESPSKVMKKEVGANLAEGMSEGWTDKIDAVKNKMALDTQGIIARIQTAVNLEQSRMAQGVGVRDTGFSEVAQAVGMQTAGINSLASEYRRGSSAQVTVPLIINGRELGRAIVDLGNEETVRTGTSLVIA